MDINLSLLLLALHVVCSQSVCSVDKDQKCVIIAKRGYDYPVRIIIDGRGQPKINNMFCEEPGRQSPSVILITTTAICEDWPAFQINHARWLYFTHS